MAKWNTFHILFATLVLQTFFEHKQVTHTSKTFSTCSATDCHCGLNIATLFYWICLFNIVCTVSMKCCRMST